MRCHRLSAIPPPPPRRDREIIGGLIAAGEIAAVVGAPGSGKSAIAVLIAKAVASGDGMFDRQTRAGAVVYVASERSTETVRRLRATAGDDAPLFVVPDRLDLADRTAMTELADAITKATEGDLVRLVVIDTLAASMAGLDENATRDMGIATMALRKLLAVFPDAGMLVLHHSGRDGTTRGSSVLPGDADVVLTVTGGTTKTATITKANAVPEGQSFAFRLDATDDQNGEPVVIATPANALAPAQQVPKATLKGWPAKAFEALPEGDGIALSTWRQAFFAANPDADRGTFRDARNALEKRGLIAVEGERVKRVTSTISHTITHVTRPSETDRVKPTGMDHTVSKSHGETGPCDPLPLKGYRGGSHTALPVCPAIACEKDDLHTAPQTDCKTPTVQIENLPVKIDDADRAGWDREEIVEGDEGNLITADDLEALIAPLDAKATWSPPPPKPGPAGRQADPVNGRHAGISHYTLTESEALNDADMLAH